MNSDPGRDGGTIEISSANSPWTNIVNESTVQDGYDSLYSISDTVTALGQPGFSGFSRKYISLWFDGANMTDSYDSIALRFTFASNSVIDSLDGWMIESIAFNPIYEAVQNYYVENLFQVFPNPAIDVISISGNLNDNEKWHVRIFNSPGAVFYLSDYFNHDLIDVSGFPPGIYIVECATNEIYSTQKFVIVK